MSLRSNFADLALGQFEPSWRWLAERRIGRATRKTFGGRAAIPALRVRFSSDIKHGWDGIFLRRPDGIVLELPAFNARGIWIKAAEHGPAYLFWLMAASPEVREMSVTLADGDQPSAARFSPSTNRRDVVPIPDPFFFRHDGFTALRDFVGRNDVAWNRRSDDIVWRGSSSGWGTFDAALGLLQPKRASARLLLCLALREIAGTDAGITKIPREEIHIDALRAQGIGKDPLAEESWIGRKFAIDIDGQSNTWSNLITRLHLGCCVLKIASEYGYRQWYYDRLTPWQHYIPVRTDLADLAEKIAWARAHESECREIAANGRALARSLTTEFVTREAASLIEANWRAADGVAQ